MKIGVINAGNIGSRLAKAWVQAGHEVMLSKDGDRAKLQPLLAQLGDKALVGELEEMAYIQTHITRPETLSVAMMDSPVGVASWITEKYHSWADKRKRRFEDIFTRDQLLNEVMLYLVTDTFRTSLWTYAAFQDEPPALPLGRKITVPTAVTQWQDTIHPLRPREERESLNGKYCSMDCDAAFLGHFPFYEERERYVADLIEFSRKLR